MKKKIEYTVTFELEDFEKFLRSYPNFQFNYSTFEEWAQLNIDSMIAAISDLEGCKITANKSK